MDEQLASKSHQLREEMINTICTTLEVQVYGAENATTKRLSQFQVQVNRAWQVAIIGSDAYRHCAKESLEREMYQVTPAEHKLFYKFFKHHEHQLLQEVETKAIGPKTIFAKNLAHIKTAADEEVYAVANMTSNKQVEFQVNLFNAETEATI